MLATASLVVSGLAVVATTPGATPVAAAQSAGTESSTPSELESARAQAKDTGKRVELTSKRTETTTTFVEPSGVFTTDYAATPIRVRRDGAWVPIDRALEERSGAWRPKAAAADVAVSAGGSSAPLAKVADGDRSLAMGWPSALPSPAVDGPVANYDLSDGRALKVTATSTGFRVHLVLSEQPSSPLVVRLPLALSGLSISERADGTFALTDDSGKTVFDVAAPIMWDATKSESGDPANATRVAARLVTEKGKQVLELVPDMTYLASATYPVTVDPEISSVGRVRDTFVASNHPTTSYGAEPYLRTGKETSTSSKRSFAQWDTPALAGKVILDSQLKLYNYHSATCTPKRVHVYPLTEARTIGATWNNMPSYHAASPHSTYKDFSHGNETLGCANASESITVTSLVTAWINGSIPNYGLILRVNEADTANFKAFCSMNEDPTHSSCYNADRNPTLSVSYTTKPDSVDRRSMTPGDSAEVGTLTPTLHGKFSDPDGDNGKIQYQVYSGASGPLVVSGDGPTVADKADSAWTVPAGKLTAGATYRWRARGMDANGVAGAWSATKFFNTQNASLIGEQRRFSFEDRDLTDRLQMRTNVANGNQLVKAKDLHIRGTGIDFTLDRYWNSRSTSVSALGKGWVLGVGHDVKLIPAASSPGTSDVTYVAPSGFTARFANQGTDSWGHPPGVDADLDRKADGTWELKFHKTEGKYVFNSAGRFEKEVDRNGNTLAFTYNASGLLSTVKDTQDRITTLSYVSGRLDTVTDSTGRSVSYAYDAAGNLDTVTDAAGKVVRYRYNGDLVDQISYGENSITRLDYRADGSRRLIDHFTSFDPGNGNPTSATTAFQYLSGETKVTDPNGNNTSTTGDGITTYRYDDRDRVTKVIDQLGHEQSKSYSSMDNVTVLTGALQKQVTMTYDQNDENLTAVSLPTGARSEFSYADGTHPHSVTEAMDPQVNTTTFTYTPSGNPDTTRTDEYPGIDMEDRDYNTDGTLSRIEDGNGTITAFGYDTKGNLTSVNNPAPLGDVTMTPDALSRLVTQTDGKNQTTSFTYDPIDRQDVVTFHGGLTVDQDYDAAGNMTKVTDATGITGFLYDKLNRQTRKTLPDNQQLRYEYDHSGNLTEYGDAGGDVSYTYNQANLLTELLEPGASAPVKFEYDDDNQRTKTIYPTATPVNMDMVYDDSKRQKSIKATRGTTTLSSFDYDYTKAGADTALRQKVTEPSGATTYGYDLLNRLTSASGALSRSYEYDIDFNRTKKTVNGTQTSYGYNAANQLTTVNGTQTYNYDGNGNLTSGDGWSFAYNTANQTTSIAKPGGSALSPLTYAGQDQTERRQAGDTTFVTSLLGVSSATSPAGTGTLSVASVGEEETKPPKGETHYYTRDNNGNLISLRTSTGRYYYLFDGLGSVVGLTDNTGTKVNSYKYDPYGEQITATQQVANPWRYVAGHYDGQTGLTKFGTRYYNPTEARFTQPDPSGQDLDYMYAGCNPTNFTDPSGLFLDDLISAVEDIGTAVLGCLGGAVAAVEGFGVYAIAYGAAYAGVGAGVAIAGTAALGCVVGAAGALTVGVNPLNPAG